MVKVINGDGWKIYDGVSEVSHSIINGQFECLSDTDDFVQKPIPKQLKASEFLNNRMVNLSLTFLNGSTKSVIAWSPVYLLNDSGKTVERI